MYQIAKILLHLSLVEPGENWIGETYSSVPDHPPMPGWQLSVVWFTEEGLPNFGVMTSCYFSGDGEEGLGFLPSKDIRYALLSTVLIRTDDYRSVHDEIHWPVVRQTPVSELTGLLKALPENVTWSYESPASKVHQHVQRRQPCGQR